MKKCDEISANAEYSSLRKEGEELSTIKNIEMKIRSDRVIKKWARRRATMQQQKVRHTASLHDTYTRTTYAPRPDNEYHHHFYDHNSSDDRSIVMRRGVKS